MGKLRQLGSQFKRQSEQQSQQRREEWTTVLTAPQREKLRAEVERVYRRRYDDPLWFEGIAAVGDGQGGAATPAAPLDPVKATLNLPVYEWLDNRPSANNWESARPSRNGWPR